MTSKPFHLKMLHFRKAVIVTHTGSNCSAQIPWDKVASRSTCPYLEGQVRSSMS